MDCIMAVVAMDRVVMTWRVHVLALEDEALAFAWSRQVPVLGRDDTSDHHNLELAIVHHCWFLHYYNMDPRWNCLGYQSILVGMSVAAMIVVSKSWINRSTIFVASLFAALFYASRTTFALRQRLSVAVCECDCGNLFSRKSAPRGPLSTADERLLLFFCFLLLLFFRFSCL